MKGSRNQAVRLGMLRDKFTDDAHPGALDVSLLDAGGDPKLRKKFSKHIADGSGSVGTDFR